MLLLAWPRAALLQDTSSYPPPELRFPRDSRRRTRTRRRVVERCGDGEGMRRRELDDELRPPERRATFRVDRPVVLDDDLLDDS